MTLFSLTAYAESSKIASQRAQFQQAYNALNTNNLQQFNQLKKGLKTYPLYPYLEYQYLRRHLTLKNNKRISQFLHRHSSTFYGEQLRNLWLNKLGQKKAWSLYLKYYQGTQPASRQCLQLQALIHTGQVKQAMSRVPALWTVPYSQHKACDPVFSLWQKKGNLTETLRWKRIHLALEDKQYKLAKYLAKSLKDSTTADAWISLSKTANANPEKALRGIAKPTKTTAISLKSDVPMARSIIAQSLIRMARKSTSRAFKKWQEIKPNYHFSVEEQHAIQANIARRSALRREHQALRFFADIPNQEWRVRSALWQQNWPAVKKAILSLEQKEQKTNRWQYWLGRAQKALGEKKAANETFKGIVLDRDYYSFLAADQLGQPYHMQHQPIDVDKASLEAFKQRPAVQQLYEFRQLKMKTESRRQAYYLRQHSTARELQLLATLTHKWHWPNQTIALLGKAKYWDALNLRFPLLYQKEINYASKVTALDPSWIFAITRQESAFNPHARSRVGATGLMQLMPQTGKRIAKIIDKPLTSQSELLNPKRNIELGSAYLHRMYNKNQHNIVLATASYNAGPHRVAKWLPQKNMPADIWIENIPFNETRHYAQTVLSYIAIFDYQRKQKMTPISQRMPIIRKAKKP